MAVRGVLVLAILLAACGLAGCEQKDSRSTKKPAVPAVPAADTVALPAEKPAYSFADGLADAHPEIVGFMQHFLETCLAGDYTGYRQLVARATDPESRTRFERMLHALKSLHVEDIVKVESKQLPDPAYLVTGTAEFNPDERASARRKTRGPRRLGVLVFQEEGEWRLMLAPRELQPIEDETQPTSGPATTTSAPSYPWDEDGDS